MPGDDPREADMLGRHHDHNITVNVDLGQLVGVIAAMQRQIDRIERHQTALKELIVADFSKLDAAVEGLGAAVARIDTDFQALKDQLATDATDQAAVDELTAKVQASIDAVEATDPTA